MARWDLEIRGPAGAENGDLRLARASGRILLQHHDSAFQPLTNLHLSRDEIAFDLGGEHRHFRGTVTDTLMWGIVSDADGTQWEWEALPLGPHSTRWPVPPRVAVRQLAIGSSTTAERIPGAWMAALPGIEQLLRERNEQASLLSIARRGESGNALDARRASLGLDPRMRVVVQAEMARILARRDLDPRMQQIFRPARQIKLDIHDAAIDEARHYLARFDFGNAMRGLGALAGEVLVDSATAREQAWRLWQRLSVDSTGVLARIDSLQRVDPLGANSVRALLAGYEDAVTWWRNAVTLLLRQRWLDTPDGARSPAQLMARFWSSDSLPLPDIMAVPVGDGSAAPLLGAAHIGPFLLQPRNGVAAEWLAGDGMQQALDAWRPMQWGEPLNVVIGDRSTTVVSPRQAALARPSAFIGARDAIRIDPSIMPLYAVATIIHEWHHLLAAERRLEGSHPPALRMLPQALELRADDPWLSEGFAEWATMVTLQPGGRDAALMLLSQAEKRLAISTANPDDPHLLGFRLVDALAARLHGAVPVRELLVASLHDLAAVARRGGMAGNRGGPPRTLNRPANSAVIPEITFTWDEGLAFDVSRRFIIPNIRSEL